MMETEAISELLAEKQICDADEERYRQSMSEGEFQFVAPPLCPLCGSNRGQWRGYRPRKKGHTVHRRWCRGCGRWFGV